MSMRRISRSSAVGVTGGRAWRPGRPPLPTPTRSSGGKSGGRKPGSGDRGRRRPGWWCRRRRRRSSGCVGVRCRGPRAPRSAVRAPHRSSPCGRAGLRPSAGSRVGPAHGAVASLSSSSALDRNSAIRREGERVGRTVDPLRVPPVGGWRRPAETLRILLSAVSRAMTYQEPCHPARGWQASLPPPEQRVTTAPFFNGFLLLDETASSAPASR
jgi:hypothetical protein